MRMVMLAAQVWTYWFAPPLLATTLALVVATAVGYYRKVAVPRYLADQQRRLEQVRSARLEQPAQLPTETPPERMPLAA